MTASSFRAMALATLLTTATVSAQRIILLPATSTNVRLMTPMGLTPSGSGGVENPNTVEPPCRQRRLEPWRHHIREQCRVEAATHCHREEEERELHSPQQQMQRSAPSNPFIMTSSSSSSSPFAQMEKEIDSFFSSVLNAPSPIRSSEFAGGDDEDPFDAIFSNMIDFSLRAFDQMMSDVPAARPVIVPTEQRLARFVVDEGAEVAEGEEGVEKVERVENRKRTVVVPSSGAGFDASADEMDEESDDFDSTDPLVVPSSEDSSSIDEMDKESDDWGIQPNEGKGFIVEVSESPEKKPEEIPPEEEEDEEDPIPPPPQESSSTTSEDGVVEMEIPTQTLTAEQAAEDTLDMLVSKLAHSAAVNMMSSTLSSVRDLTGTELSQRLFDLGNGILEDAHTRRRLSEGGTVDPHLEVKERLGRRLTEYRTDLFRYPDGTVTLYRSSSFPSSPTANGEFTVMSRPSPFMMTPHSFGSEDILGMGSSSVDDCIKSRFDNGDLLGGCHEAVVEFLFAIDDRSRPPPGYNMRSTSPNAQQVLRIVPPTTFNEVKEVSSTPSLWNALFAFIGIWALVSALTSCCDGDDCDCCDDDEEEENGHGDDGDGFEYARLPEDDGSDNSAGTKDDHVFVGVPVQVV